MADPRHHHYISECYLRGFSVLRKKGKYQLQVFDSVQHKHYPNNPRNVAGERDFNRLDEEQGNDPYALEKAYAAFEGELAPAIQRVVDAGAFTSENDRNLIINMIGLFALRNPHFREQVRGIHEDIARKLMSLALSTPERWAAHMERAKGEAHIAEHASISYEEMKVFFDSKDYRIDLNRGYQIGTELKAFDTLLPYLVKRKWWIVKAGRNCGGFITSDNPVALMWADPNMRGGFYPPGFGLGGTQVTFPLTSRVALLGAFELKEQSDELAEPFVAQINGATIAHSRRYVYARDLNFLYQLRRGEGAKKASRLPSDPHFIKRTGPKPDDE